MGFAEDVFNFRDKALLAANNKLNRIFEELCTSIVILSPSPSNPGPYAKGLLANQWYTAIGANNFSTELSMSINDYGIESLSRIKAIVAQNIWLGKDASASLTNNVPYVYLAETVGWMSSMNPKWRGAVPYKMVAKSVIAVKGQYM